MADDITTELEAIKTIQETLEPLKPEVRDRVLDYVFRLLGIAPLLSATPAPIAPTLPPPPAVAPLPPAAAVPKLPVGNVIDIQTLTEQKRPTTASQMIAIVAYYLLHHAPAEERQNFISVEDLQKYFVQAGYPLPEALSMALIHAKNAGYLDVVEKGKYRLNSVGHNLVAHKMPKADGGAPVQRKRNSRKAPKVGKKAVKKAKR
ncbi:hypothetical protein [Rhodopseudomonas palustris]|uniref:hypothetical protein n=1 Tax=Rhodopseudomonas palustris TaxID=1076 RepID=UPI000641B774|nr:hypothetical protein [Rhodopseudomonas palustris]